MFSDFQASSNRGRVRWYPLGLSSDFQKITSSLFDMDNSQVVSFTSISFEGLYSEPNHGQ